VDEPYGIVVIVVHTVLDCGGSDCIIVLLEIGACNVDGNEEIVVTLVIVVGVILKVDEDCTK